MTRRPPRAAPTQSTGLLDLPLEVTMSWCPLPIWLAPDEASAARLVGDGIPRARIYTLSELLDLLDLTPAEARRRPLDGREPIP